MKEYVVTKMSDEMDKISSMEGLELVNYDGGDLANHFTTDEIILFDGVICKPDNQLPMHNLYTYEDL